VFTVFTTWLVSINTSEVVNTTLSRKIFRVRTILALGYWVLPNIFQYWVVLGIGQYFYWLSYPIPILLVHLDTSCQQMTAGKLGRRLSKARVLANEGTLNTIQQTVILAFITYMVILIAIVWVSYCCIHIHLLKNQYSTSILK